MLAARARQMKRQNYQQGLGWFYDAKVLRPSGAAPVSPLGLDCGNCGRGGPRRPDRGRALSGRPDRCDTLAGRFGPSRQPEVDRVPGFLLKLETLEGELADPRELSSAVPDWAPVMRSTSATRTLRVVGVRDADADSPPVLIVDEAN